MFSLGGGWGGYEGNNFNTLTMSGNEERRAQMRLYMYFYHTNQMFTFLLQLGWPCKQKLWDRASLCGTGKGSDKYRTEKGKGKTIGA